MKRKRSDHEQEFVDSRVCTYRCGIDGCRFRRTSRLDAWLAVRDSHRAEAHPGYRERKRRGHTIPSVNKTVRYEAAA